MSLIKKLLNLMSNFCGQDKGTDFNTGVV